MTERIGLDPLTALQVFSLLTSLWFLVFAIMTLRRVIHTDKWFVFASTLMLFFPGILIHSIRIGNEPLLYLLITITLYLLSIWWSRKNGREKNTRQSDGYLFASIVLAFLATITKATGLILFLLIGALLCIIIIRKRMTVRDLINQYLSIAVAFLVFLILSCLITFYHPLFTDSSQDWLIGNRDSLNSDLYVGNDLINYVNLEPKLFIDEPYNDPWSDVAGRQFFPHYFLKSMLYGEFNLGVESIGFASVVNAIFLLVCLLSILVIAGFVKFRYEHTPLYLILLLLFLSEIVMRYRMPTSANSDFRFILPILIPLFAILSLSLESIKGRYAFVSNTILSLFTIFLLLSNFLLLLYA